MSNNQHVQSESQVLNSFEDSHFGITDIDIFERTESNLDFFEGKKPVDIPEFMNNFEDNEYEYWKLLRFSLNSDISIFQRSQKKLTDDQDTESSPSFLHSILLKLNTSQ